MYNSSCPQCRELSVVLMASTDSPLIFDAAEAAAALANEVRTTLKTRWPEACALAKWSHRVGPAATWDDSQLPVDASYSDVELIPLGAPSMASSAGSNPRVAKRSLKHVAASGCMPCDVTTVHDARRRRRWRVGILVDATSKENIIESIANTQDEASGVATLGGLEECHVPVLPLLRRRRRCWRTSSFRRSVSTMSAHSQNVAQIAKKGAASKFKRLRRIRESGSQSESVSMHTTLAGSSGKREVEHLERMSECGRRPVMESRSVSFVAAPSLCEVLEPSAVTKSPIEAAKLSLPGPPQVTHRAAAPPLQQRLIRGSCTSLCTSNLASIVGDAQLPGWSARLILYLGGGAPAAKPLACVSRDTAWSLLRDAVQLSAELRPIAHALAGASTWGDKEEIQFSCVQNSGAMLSVFATLDIGSCSVGNNSAFKRIGDNGALALQLSGRPRRQTQVRAMDALRDSEVHIEQVRVNRVGCLLSNLAQRARSLSHRFTAHRSGASRPSRVPL